ncbi:MAG: hypothetical protein WCJ72_05385 [Chryseobacterium sp.]
MIWKCNHCGTENQNEIKQCVGCGFSMFPKTVLFCSRNSGKLHSISVKNESEKSIIVGSDILKILDDVDLKYVDKFQFKIEEVFQKGILIKPIPSARNMIYLNGFPVPDEGVLLEENDLLSINGKFFFLDLKLS